MHRLVSALAGLLALAVLPAHGGVFSREDIAARFPSPLIVGEKDRQVPVWPIAKQDGTQNVLVGYVFESVDIAPVPGFVGVPPNLLIALAPDGTLLDVGVVSQHEPVFLDGLGEAPLLAFVGQYQGKNLRQNIKVGSNLNRGDQGISANVYIDGVAKATASIKIVNESVLAAALKVARARLGFAEGVDPARTGRVREDLFEPLDWAQLVERGYVKRFVVSNREVEAAFAGSAGEGLDAEALARPDAPFIELYAAYLNVPTVGRSLLGEAGWRRLRDRLEDGQHAIWLASAGRYAFVAEDFTRGSVPDRLALNQGGLALDMRDLDLDLFPAAAGAPELPLVMTLRVFAQAGLDPALPWTLATRAARAKGQILPEIVVRDFPLEYRLPERFFVLPEPPAPPWLATWKNRWWEIALTAAACALLAVLLARSAWISSDPRRLLAFRLGFLAFTLGFIGWYAQGQLSIVNLLAVVNAAQGTGDLRVMLYDPISVLLWGFAAVTFFAWGRGTFCGWLCPFGALQEFVALAARWLRLPQWRVRERLDRALQKIKYAVLAAILGTALVSTAWADRLAEFEPFKTAITLAFQRAWPPLAWAVALLVLSAAVYKSFCRWLCPLGAFLALAGRLRRWDWIARRAECARPCQLCRHRCEYNAIERSGTIRYDECFQCLDCVGIYHDAGRCAPLLLEAKRGRRRVIPIIPAPVMG